MTGREVDYPCVSIAILRVELLKSSGSGLSALAVPIRKGQSTPTKAECE